MASVLVTDIGGTNCRLKIIQFTGETLKEATYSTRCYRNLIDLLRDFLGNLVPAAALIGTAGCVIDNTVRFLNSQWDSVSGAQIESEFSIRKVLILNDFVVAAYGCLTLKPEEMWELSPGVAPLLQAPKAVIGVGTGIGESFLTWDGAQYEAWPSEGGNKEYAPKTQLEWEYGQYMLQQVNTQDSEFPQFKPLSGPTIELCFGGVGAHHLYYFLSEKFPDEIDSEFHSKFQAEPGNRLKMLMDAGFARESALCERAVDIWLRNVAYEVGNLIARTLPYGGLYIIGGVVSKNAERISSSAIFQAALYTKAPHICEIIAQVPIYIVQTEDNGLRGSLYKAQQLLN